MAKIRLNPYIFFQGNAKEAMEFYKSALGGELSVQTYEETPGDTPENLKGKLMHASLETDDIVIFASDTEQASAKAAKVSLCLGGSEDDEERFRKIFDDLSEGGEVSSPLKKEFWGDTFGSFRDKFGVDWMMNIAGEQQAK